MDCTNMKSLKEMHFGRSKVKSLTWNKMPVPLKSGLPRIEFENGSVRPVNFEKVEMGDYAFAYFLNGSMDIVFAPVRFERMTSATGMFIYNTKTVSFAGLEFPVVRKCANLFSVCSKGEIFPTEFPECTEAYGLYNRCLKAKVVCTNFPKAASMSLLYNSCESLGPDFEVHAPVATSADNILSGCISLVRLRLITPKLRWIQNGLMGCSSLEEVYFELSGTCIIRKMCQNCVALRRIVITDTSKIDAAENAFQNTPLLEEVSLSWPGLTAGTDMFRDSGLKADQINEILDSLPVRTNNPVITFTGCPGATDCDPSIGTRKGWTVQN